MPKKGLLDETKDVSKAKHFTSNLEQDACQQLLHDRNVVFNHLMEDVGEDFTKIEPYLTNAHDAARDFLNNGEIADRKNLRFTLDSLAETRGQYMILLGSKGMGKSTLLKDIEKRHCEKIFRIDMRQNKDIIEGLLAALKMQYSYQQKSVQSWGASILQAVTMFFREYTKLKDQKVAEKVTEEKNTLSFVINQMINQFGYITVIIDEANLPFSKPYIINEKDIAQAKATLELFTALAKQDKKMNVVLVSSNHEFPVQLSSEPLFFDMHSFTQVVYVHELSPRDMYLLLTKTWQLGHHLSTLLISFYGGDIDAIYQALYRMHLISRYHMTSEREAVDFDSDHDESTMFKKEFVHFPLLNSNTVQSIYDALEQCKGQGLNMYDAKNFFLQFAREGYLMMHPNDENYRAIVPILTKHSVGYLMARSSQHVGSYHLLDMETTLHVDRQTKLSEDTMLLPYKQSIRLAIMHVLEDTN